MMLKQSKHLLEETGRSFFAINVIITIIVPNNNNNNNNNELLEVIWVVVNL
jgi:hypothetical protein